MFAHIICGPFLCVWNLTPFLLCQISSLTCLYSSVASSSLSSVTMSVSLTNCHLECSSSPMACFSRWLAHTLHIITVKLRALCIQLTMSSVPFGFRLRFLHAFEPTCSTLPHICLTDYLPRLWTPYALTRLSMAPRLPMSTFVFSVVPAAQTFPPPLLISLLRDHLDVSS
jgi:hypothetical protein